MVIMHQLKVIVWHESSRWRFVWKLPVAYLVSIVVDVTQKGEFTAKSLSRAYSDQRRYWRKSYEVAGRSSVNNIPAVAKFQEEVESGCLLMQSHKCSLVFLLSAYLVLFIFGDLGSLRFFVGINLIPKSRILALISINNRF